MPSARRSFAPILCTALYLGIAPLQAQQVSLDGMVTAADIDRIQAIAGAHATVDRRTRDDGSQWIRGEYDGIIYSISFLNCQAGAACTTIQFRAWWNSEGAHSMEAMNGWNRDWRFATAYLDEENDATVKFDVNLAGGVSAANLDDTVQWWHAAVRRFREEVIDPGYAATRPSAAAPTAPVTPAPGVAPPAELRPAPPDSK